MLPQCNLETGVNEPVGLIMAEITEEAADVIAPGAAVEIESMERLTVWRKFKKRNLEARLRSAYFE